jgi:RHS repeat-associated protein
LHPSRHHSPVSAGPSTGASYDSNNQISSNGYDAAGDLAADTITGDSYLYDGDGRVCAMQMSVNGIPFMTGYLYDAEGHRVAKGSLTHFTCDRNANGFSATAVYVLGPSGEQMTEMTNISGTWRWAHTNVYAPGLSATYDADLTENTEESLYFDLSDWLGTRRQQTDYAGNPCLNFTSLPYGDGLTPITVSCLSPSGDATEHHFTGKERDAESGNDYFGARYFASSMGRMLSPDPIGGGLTDPQSLNKYAYALNNPLRFTDPTGLYVCETGQDCSGFEKVLAGLRNSNNADVARAAAAYGAAGEDNDVVVGFADMSKKGENGTTHSTIESDPNDPSGNTLRAHSDVTINSKISGDDYAAAVGHEGSHAADAQDVVKSGLTGDNKVIHAGMNITPYQSEQRAYGVTNAILASGNQSRKFDCGMNACTLGVGSGMPAQLPGVIDQILAHSHIYDQGGKPMSSTNQGASVVNGVTPTPPKASVPQ